jgi:hypothetical protein
MALRVAVPDLATDEPLRLDPEIDGTRGHGQRPVRACSTDDASPRPSRPADTAAVAVGMRIAPFLATAAILPEQWPPVNGDQGRRVKLGFGAEPRSDTVQLFGIE